MSLKIKTIIVKESQSLVLIDDNFAENSPVFYTIILEKNVHLELCIAITRSVKIEIAFDLQADSSSFDLIFLYALSSDQVITLITKQKHIGKQTTSRIFARGMVKDRAQVLHEGLICIAPQAEKSDAVLNHTTIVLDGKAQVVLIPSIEVLNYDVQCSHGAAVGQFDQQQLWYLKTRGLDEKQAYEMLVRSFYQEFIHHFDQPEKLLESLCQKIV